MKRFRTALLCVSLLALPAVADTLQVPSADEARTDLRGLTMDAVRARLGTPRKTLPPVGDPPITRWVYDDLTVYFENDRVIHAVRHRKRPAPEPQ